MGRWGGWRRRPCTCTAQCSVDGAQSHELCLPAKAGHVCLPKPDMSTTPARPSSVQGASACVFSSRVMCSVAGVLFRQSHLVERGGDSGRVRAACDGCPWRMGHAAGKKLRYRDRDQQEAEGGEEAGRMGCGWQTRRMTD